MSGQFIFKPNDMIRLKLYSKFSGESGYVKQYSPEHRAYIIVIDSLDPARPFEWLAIADCLELIDRKETFEPGEFESIFGE